MSSHLTERVTAKRRGDFLLWARVRGELQQPGLAIPLLHHSSNVEGMRVDLYEMVHCKHWDTVRLKRLLLASYSGSIAKAPSLYTNHQQLAQQYIDLI